MRTNQVWAMASGMSAMCAIAESGEATSNQGGLAPLMPATAELSPLEMFLASTAKDVPAAPQGKTTVIAMGFDDVRKIVPEFGGSLVQPDGTAYDGAMMYTVTADDPETFGLPGTKLVIRPFVRVSPELAKYITATFGSENRSQQKTTMVEYTEAQQTKKWSYVGNTAIFTVGEAGDIVTQSLKQHNGGHTMHAVEKSGATILMTFIFGVPKIFTPRIDVNRVRNQASMVEMVKPFLKRLNQIGMVEGFQNPAVSLKTTQIDAMRRIYATALGIVDKVRTGEQAKTGGKGLGNEETYEQAIKYQAVMERAVEDIFVLVGKDKTFLPHHLAAALVLTACTEDKDGKLTWQPKEARQFIEQVVIGINPNFTDINLPFVVLRETFKAWDLPANNKNKTGAGINIRWACLKLAYLKAVDGTPLTRAMLEAVKATDCTKSELRLGGIDDYVSAVDQALSATTAPAGSTGSEPQPLFPVAEEPVDK